MKGQRFVREVMESKQRILVISFVVGAIFFLLLLRLWHLQILSADDYRNMSENNRLRFVPVAASRGSAKKAPASVGGRTSTLQQRLGEPFHRKIRSTKPVFAGPGRSGVAEWRTPEANRNRRYLTDPRSYRLSRATPLVPNTPHYCVTTIVPFIEVWIEQW